MDTNIPGVAIEPLYDVFNKKLVRTDGLVLEFGVFSGKSINYIASKIDTQVYGFDSFEGLPETWRNGFQKGAFNRGGSLPSVSKNVTLVKGWFNETLPSFLDTHTSPVTFLHIDCDLYSSTKCVFDLVKTRIADGCVIVFDELLQYPGYDQHEWKAWWELVKETGLTYEWICKFGEKAAVRILKNPQFAS